MKRATNVIELKKIMVEQRLEKICDLSAATGINRNTISAVLSGKSQPSVGVMDRLIQVLNIDPARAGEIFFSK